MCVVDDYAKALVEGVDGALSGWVTSCVIRVMEAWAGSVAAEVLADAEVAGQAARAAVVPELRALLSSDVDEQRQTPLTVIRAGVRFPTAVLRSHGVPPVPRDPFAAQAFPDDVYDLSPASFADIAPQLADIGIAWGASKAMAHRRRHRPPAP